jgi:hypothetical protein
MALRLLMIAGLACVLASGCPRPSTGHDWYRGLKSAAGVACCGSAECRPAAARYNERTGLWETEVITNTWLPVPPSALAQVPSPDGNFHVCEYAGTIRCFFQPGEVRRAPREEEKRPELAHGRSPFPASSMRLARWQPQRRGDGALIARITRHQPALAGAMSISGKLLVELQPHSAATGRGALPREA